jgi:hypothetical protein
MDCIKKAGEHSNAGASKPNNFPKKPKLKNFRKYLVLAFDHGFIKVKNPSYGVTNTG